MTIKHFGPGEKLDRAATKFRTSKRQPEDYREMLSPLYSAFTAREEFEVATWSQKLWWGGWTFRILVRLWRQKPDELTPDQCDVWASTAYRLSQGVRPIRSIALHKAEEFAIAGRSRSNKSGGGHTWWLCDVTLAYCALDQGFDHEAAERLNHYQDQTQVVSAIENKLQMIRVYRGMALVAAKLYQRQHQCALDLRELSMTAITEMNQATEALGELPPGWEDVPDKNRDAADEVQMAFG